MNISVILTTYERSSFLKRALDSLMAQTMRPYEIIVIDDGSRDDSAAVAAVYPVRYVWQENRGISTARNHGIRASAGDWVCFLDGDDCWHPEKLAAQVSYHREHPELVISQTEEKWIRQGRFVNQMKKHRKRSGDIFTASLPLCLITPSSVMLQKTVFDAVGCFDETLPVCEDYDLWLRITLHYPVGLVPKTLVTKYGGHSDQLSQRYKGMDRFRIYALEKILSDPCITPEKKKAVYAELKKKCALYGAGCLKHNKAEEGVRYCEKARYYETLMME